MGSNRKNAALSGRIREIREELYGEEGGPELARALGISWRTWANYEAGVLMLGIVLLRFIERTGADPHWLLTGEGPRYRDEGWEAGGSRFG
jgi:hypothetical protein